jgi:hypothetical protein
MVRGLAAKCGRGLLSHTKGITANIPAKKLGDPPMNTTFRYCDTPTLIRLINEGEKYNFNRQLDLDMVLEDVDPEGLHVLSLELSNHFKQMLHPNDSLAEYVVYQRCSGLMKIRNSIDPQKVWIDIAADTWETLPVLAEADA